MPDRKYKIVIKSPNDKIGCETVECETGWKIQHLKHHLSENYPTRPPQSSQRLIHAGKLLKDETLISSLFPEDSEVQTIHLVCPMSKKMLPKPEEQETKIEIRPDDIQKYQEAYYRYLQEFYLNSGNVDRPAQTPAPQVWWPYWMSPGMWPQPSPWNNLAQYPGIPSSSGTSPMVTPIIPSDTSMPRPVGDSLQQEVADPAPERQAEQPPVMMNNPLANGVIRADEFGEGGEVDVIDRIYMLFRFCLFVGLCFAYSSLDKAIIVFSVAAYVYLYNIYRRYAAVNRVAQAAQRPEQRTENPSETENARQNQTPDNPSETNNPDQELRQRSVPTDQQQPESPGQNIQPEIAPPYSRFISNLRVVASTSYQFISGLFASLIPEQPPPIRLD